MMAHSSTGIFPSSPIVLLLIHSRLGRNIKGFMIQGGDPTGTGKAGESIWGGWFNDEIRPTVKACSCSLLLHKLLNRGYIDSSIPVGWSQWPIKVPTRMVASSSLHMRNSRIWMVSTTSLRCCALTDASHVQGKYTIFGRIIDGAEDTLTAMERVPVNAKNRPLEDIQLENVRCISRILHFGRSVRCDLH